jgi:ligand-binding sensor domain-containing protein/signal transduction histidine kinase/DNA-binding response OmpR family regulator
MRKVFTILLLMMIEFHANAQEINYNFYNYSTENGLPTNDYQNIYQDSYGFFWLASFDGLFKWDGYTIKKYYHDEKNPQSIGNNIVYAVFEDSKKRLWVGTIDGLNLYDRATDSFIKCPILEKDERTSVKAILEDKAKQLWLGTSKGLCRFDGDARKPHWITPSLQEGDLIFCLTVDDANNIWAGTFNKGVQKYNQQTKKIELFNPIPENKDELSRNKINCILAASDHKIWVGTEDKGLSLLNNEGAVVQRYQSFSRKDFVPQNCITSLYEDKNKTIWIGMGRGVMHVKGKEDAAPRPVNTAAQNNSHAKLVNIASIIEDKFGNTWFGSIAYGLFCTNSNKNVFNSYLQNVDALPGLKTTVVTSFYEDAHHKVWVGTNGNGILQFDPETQKTAIPQILALNSLAVNDVKGDNNGKLWIATWGGGVKEFDPVTKQVTNFFHDPANNNSIIYNDVKAVLPDDSIVWIGTHGEGLAVYDKKRNHFIHYKNNTTFPFNMHDPAWINHLFKDSKKRLWISTYSGVFMYDGKTLAHFEHDADSASITSNSINMVAEDGKGNIWVISELGLDQFNEHSHKFSRFTERYNLPEAMKSIVTGNNNTLWISCNEGIVSFDPSTKMVKRYDKNDGLFDNTYFQKAVLKSNSGTLYFGGPKGFNVFDPDALKPLHIPTYFYFTDLYIYNELQQPQQKGSPLHKILGFTDTLVLSRKQAFFSVSFSAINLYAPQKTKYSYRLEGLHEEWIDVKGDRKVSFTNLQPGNYLLKVRYTDANGDWQTDVRGLHIMVLPPWWQTWWFKLLALLVATIAVVGVFYARVASIKARNKMLQGEVEKRTSELHEMNISLTEQNDEIKLQKERLELSYEEIIRQSDKILEQQQHITDQNKTLEGTVDELEKLNNTKDHFFSILAHDLKNPVSALADITGFIKHNVEKMDRRDLQDYLNGMHDASSSVFDLLVNLLNWSRTQSKKIEYKPADWNLQELIQKNAKLLEPQFNNKHIHLVVNVNSTHHIFADHNMIDTVIRNIMSNSIKFTDYNGKVTITSSEDEKMITLTITDTGIGMSAEQLEKLFSIDKANIATGTAGEKGTGLGLIISKEFLQINEGEMEVKSSPGKGSSFVLRIPKSSVTALKEAGKNFNNNLVQDKLAVDFWDAFPTDKLIKVKGRKILIVDDNKEVRDYLKLILMETFEIFEAANGLEGLRVAREVLPAVIITDLLMPGMNGVDFCKEVKQGTATSHIPVVFLTSQSEEKVQVSGYEAGADVYLTKPVKKEILIQVILNFMQTQENMHEKLLEQILTDTPVHTENVSLSKMDEEFLNKLVNFIEANISNQSLDARLICKEIAISRTILYSKIKSLTGQTVHEFIKAIRLKRSLQLLLEGKLTISQIAFEVGFNSHSYFDKCFAKQYGMGPKEYVSKKRGRRINN